MRRSLGVGTVGLMLLAWPGSGEDVIFVPQQMPAFRCGVGLPFMPQVAVADTRETQAGFLVGASGRTIDETPAGEVLKRIEAGEWVKAIQSIEALSASDGGLVLDDRGVLRPMSTLKSALIASMPAEGRRVFSRLNDAAALAKLREAKAQDDVDRQATQLAEVVNDYSLCDAAADAAAALGDLRFEAGRFDEAAALYRFAAEHPATRADDPLMIARRLVALMRSGDRGSFDALAEYARFRHADTRVDLGGQSRRLTDWLDELAGSLPTPPDTTPQTPRDALALPGPADEQYDRPLIDESFIKMMRQFAMSNNVTGLFDRVTQPVVTIDDNDGGRLFTYALGSLARLDPETGSDLWRTGDRQALAKRMQQRMYDLHQGFHQSLSIHGDTLLAVLPTARRTQISNLLAVDPDTGNTKWDWHSATGASGREGVVGEPMVHDDRVYFTTLRDASDLVLHVARLADGSKLREQPLGKVSKGQNMHSPGEMSPRLTLGRSHLLVQTNNGALIALDHESLDVAWAYTQNIRPSGIQSLRTHARLPPDSIAKHTGQVIADQGLVFAKDTRTSRVVAFREHDAALLWTAPTDPDATIVHYDQRHIYILGEQLVALDRDTGEPIWWTPHPGPTAGQPVFTEDACLVAGNQRFCRIDLNTGKLTRYREELAGRADLHAVDRRLLRVTPDRITAFDQP
ncbi:MAG: PQQ-binding-like beta-propeller repeat protein [Phycisphaeraceae bacterium]